MTKSRFVTACAAAIGAVSLWVCLLLVSMAQAAEQQKKIRIAIPSIVIDFAPLWIARDKGIFRDERIDPEVTYIQGNVRVVQSLVAGEVQFGVAGTAGAVSARAAGEEVIIIAVPMNRLDYTFVARQPVNKPADLAGKKIGIGAVGGSDELATRIALEKLGVNPASVTMITAGGSAERLTALRIGSVDAATVGGATFIGGGAGLHKVLDLIDLGVEFPFTAIFTTKKFAAANRDAVLGLIRGYMRGVRFFQENKEEAIAITARNLRTTNKDLLERQWLYVKDHVYEKIPYPTEKGFKLIFDMLAPRNPRVAALRMDDVFDASFVKELVDKGFFK
ncbi:MAG TPA: ABC transporter substrate-binding protein [Candidatus Binatia bacterium]|jgi:ABC-type nitrate/sulfonate/bicarbonate transport system substrate-binding protein|nr:ABC transporter substrate-binding protein [Candidatus Binatia bacterium]